MNSVLQAIKRYYVNAEIIVYRGKLGLESQSCQSYYEGVIKAVERCKDRYINVYEMLTGSPYKTVFSDIAERTGRATRTIHRILSIEAKNCANVIEKYENEHYEELREGLCIKTIYSTNL